MSLLSQFAGGGIKSIQRGSFNPSGASGGAITVSAVNTAKSELRYLGGVSINYTDYNTPMVAAPALRLVSSTTIDWSTPFTGQAGTICSWELTEWN